jgi:hypothetical protein
MADFTFFFVLFICEIYYNCISMVQIISSRFRFSFFDSDVKRNKRIIVLYSSEVRESKEILELILF